MGKAETIALFKGFAVLIDDAFGESRAEGDIHKDPIFFVRDALEDAGIATKTYASVPGGHLYNSLSNASFIIIDWNMSEAGSKDSPAGKLAAAGTLLGDTFRDEESKKNERSEFINNMLETTCIPLIVFTATGITEKEACAALNSPESCSKRLIVKDKGGLDRDDIVSAVMTWCTEDSGMYALKAWEHEAKAAKCAMFQHFNELSSNWVSILWEVAKKDEFGEGVASLEFGDLITRNLINRITGFEFDEDILTKKAVEKSDGYESDTDIGNATRRVLEGERFIEYDNEKGNSSPPYTGDLFYCENGGSDEKPCYYLNIRAQCSLRSHVAKANGNGCDNSAKLYLIKGECVDKSEIQERDLFVKEGVNLPGKDSENPIPYDKLQGHLSSRKDRDRVNSALFSGPKIGGGSLIGKSSEVFIPCLDGNAVVKFNLDVEMVIPFDKACEDYKRVGRLIPPYITIIQQRCASHIVRTGMFPTPIKEIL